MDSEIRIKKNSKGMNSKQFPEWGECKQWIAKEFPEWEECKQSSELGNMIWVLLWA